MENDNFIKKDKYQILIYSIVFIYFGIVIINCFGYCTYNYFHNRELPYKYNKFIFPVFNQAWDMYGNPPSTNTEIYYRYEVYNSEGNCLSNWKKVMTPLISKKRENFIAGNTVGDMAYMLWHGASDLGVGIARCYLETAADSTQTCHDVIYPGDKIIARHLEIMQLKEITNFDSIRIDYQVVFDPVPKYRTGEKKEKLVINRMPHKIIK